MKSKLVIFSLLLFCVSFYIATPAYAQNQKSHCKKVYIPKGAIKIQNNAIAVQLGNKFIPVAAVHCDGQGLYVLTTLLPKDFNGTWWCRRCQSFHRTDQRCPRWDK